MTLLASPILDRLTFGALGAPQLLKPKDVSVVIPVKNNQKGIIEFIRILLKTHTPDNYPRELIIVDNDSDNPVDIPDAFKEMGIDIRVIWTDSPGPASARNFGWRNAGGQWILFTDSDCLPSSTLISGYVDAMNGSIAYAGAVRAIGVDRLSRYYESQEILSPQTGWINSNNGQPNYIVTANALVWKGALELVGGFSEEFKEAAGEDVDWGLRLSLLGRITWAPEAVVFHDFSDGLSGFLKRFIRYGRGTRIVESKHGMELSPRPFCPNRNTLVNRFFARLQYLSLLWGYHCFPRKQRKHRNQRSSSARNSTHSHYLEKIDSKRTII